MNTTSNRKRPAEGSHDQQQNKKKKLFGQSLFAPEPQSASLHSRRKRSAEEINHEKQNKIHHKRRAEESDEQPQAKKGKMTPSKPPKTYLHRLPGELRNRIYWDVTKSGPRLNLKDLKAPAIATALPAFKDEIASIMLCDNKIRVGVHTDFHIQPPKKPLDYHKPLSPKAGKMDLAEDSWVLTIDPRVVAFRHVVFRLRTQDEKVEPREPVEFILNVEMGKTKGKPTVKSRMENIVRRVPLERNLAHDLRPFKYLVETKARQMAERKGFDGFSWDDMEELAACFGSIHNAKSKFRRKGGKTTLK